MSLHREVSTTNLFINIKKYKPWSSGIKKLWIPYKAWRSINNYKSFYSLSSHLWAWKKLDRANKNDRVFWRLSRQLSLTFFIQWQKMSCVKYLADVMPSVRLPNTIWERFHPARNSLLESQFCHLEFCNWNSPVVSDNFNLLLLFLWQSGASSFYENRVKTEIGSINYRCCSWFMDKKEPKIVN